MMISWWHISFILVLKLAQPAIIAQLIFFLVGFGFEMDFDPVTYRNSVPIMT